VLVRSTSLLFSDYEPKLSLTVHGPLIGHSNQEIILHNSSGCFLVAQYQSFGRKPTGSNSPSRSYSINSSSSLSSSISISERQKGSFPHDVYVTTWSLLSPPFRKKRRSIFVISNRYASHFPFHTTAFPSTNQIAWSEGLRSLKTKIPHNGSKIMTRVTTGIAFSPSFAPFFLLTRDPHNNKTKQNKTKQNKT